MIKLVQIYNDNNEPVSEIPFFEGTNYIVAETSSVSNKFDNKKSRNGAGKSSLIEVIDFCFGNDNSNFLICGDGDGTDFLDVSGIFLDLVRLEGRLVEEFADPLARRGNVRREDERARLCESHRRHTDDCFARAAGEDDDARAAFFGTRGVENLGRLLLIIAELERLSFECLFAELHRERVALHVAGEVLHGEARLREKHFEVAAAFRIDVGAVVAFEFEEVGDDVLEPADFLEKNGIRRFEEKPLVRAHQLEKPVAAHIVFDFRDDGSRNGVAGIRLETVEDVFRHETRGCRVPEGKVRNLIRVDVFGTFDQFREWSDRVARFRIMRCVHFDEDFHIALNDYCAIGIHRGPYLEKCDTTKKNALRR